VPLRPALPALLSAAFALALPATAPAAGRVTTPTYDVTVTRTAYGIPHVRAADYASLGYGYAKALAEDTVCTVAEAYVTASGERSRYFGPNARYAIRGNGSTATNLASDLFYQRIRDRRTVERLLAQPAPLGPKPELREAMRGYVDGWNAWLRDVGGSDGVPDPTCRGKEWVKPITEMDAYRRFYQLSLLASGGVAIDGIAGAKPLTGGTAADAAARARALPPGELDRRLGGLGSNAYAIGRDASRDGHGLLYGNPHFPWQGPERFYQAHLTVPGKVDAMGGSLLGVPIVLIGTTHGLAWSHTVSTARRFAPYQLTLVPGQPTSYLVDGQVRKMTSDRVKVKVRERDGRIGTRTRTLYSSEYGPIFTSILGLPLFPWTPVTAYALYDANADNLGRIMNHFWDMNHAQTTGEVEGILKKYQGIPWVNTIAADTAGNALYADIGSMPNVDEAKYRACGVLLGQATDLLQRLPVLDGSRAGCGPGRAADAVAPGLLGVGDQPLLKRTDHVSNMNDSYWLTNPKQPLEGFSRIIGDERTARSLRTRIGVKQIEERLAGTDGLPGTGFDLQNLMEVGMGNRVYSAELWRDGLVAGCSSAACGVLRGWNMRNDLDAKGAMLWQRFIVRLNAGPTGLALGLLGPFTKAFDARDPVNTPSGLAPLPNTQSALQQAADDLRGAGLPLDATLRQGQSVTRRGQRIPIHGGPGNSGIFNVITPTWSAKRGYTEVVHGSSFVQAVHLKPGCPDVRTILTFGESTNPESPRTSDQTELYSRKGWVKPPFCPGELEADRDAQRQRILDLRPAAPVVVTVREARGSTRPRIRVERTDGARAAVGYRVRDGRGRLRARGLRRGADVVIAPRVRRGSWSAVVSVRGRTVRLTARQR
jgi:acyl-homoserine-lactone acylase